jgi:hypothetical protein
MTAPRQQLRELDEQLRRCRDEIAATERTASDTQRAEQRLALGTLTARRLVTLQWL